MEFNWELPDNDWNHVCQVLHKEGEYQRLRERLLRELNKMISEPHEELTIETQTFVTGLMADINNIFMYCM